MKIKTSELTGAALDWAVAKCEGLENENGWTDVEVFKAVRAGGGYRYSSDWAQGGPLIEREGISVSRSDKSLWVAYRTETLFDDDYEYEYQNADKPLIAAMRCYVASKLGEEVEITEELK